MDAPCLCLEYVGIPDAGTWQSPSLVDPARKTWRVHGSHPPEGPVSQPICCLGAEAFHVKPRQQSGLMRWPQCGQREWMGVHWANAGNQTQSITS